MWTIYELKSRALSHLKYYYWWALLVCFLASLLAGGGSSGAGGNFGSSYSSSSSDYSNAESSMLINGIIVAALIVVLIVLIVGMVLTVFVGNPVIVGKKRFFMESRELNRSAGVGRLFWVFGSGKYKNVVKVMFLTDLFIFLWSLLLIIPGIIKSYEYYMVPYILSENPEMDYKSVQRLSRDMMDGNKMKTFWLTFSFIGWELLGILACCIGVYFVTPYVEATLAELYAELKSNFSNVNFHGYGKIEVVNLESKW